MGRAARDLHGPNASHLAARRPGTDTRSAGNREVGLSDEVRNVFMSHIHEDDDALPQLKGLVSKSGLVVRDGSINADKPNRATSDDYIKSGIPRAPDPVGFGSRNPRVPGDTDKFVGRLGD